jgi:hypothetical protein
MIRIDEVYRGYRISYQRGNRIAWIFAPGSALALETIPSATRAEGLEVLRRRAHAVIDEEIAQIG